MAESLKLFQPTVHYSNYLNHHFRPDRRKVSSFGITSISVGCMDNTAGSALVNISKTSVICGIKAELANPTADNPKKGYIVPNVDMSPMCSSKFMPGPPSEISQIFSQLIANLIENSSFVDSEDLCIIEGQLCWCLHIDITCLNYGGNVLDACVLAMIAAAKNAVLPIVTVKDDIPIVDSSSNPLNISSFPLSSTFAVFQDQIIADPTTNEERIASGMVTIFMKADGTICDIFMHQGCAVPESCLKKCIRLTKARCQKLVATINSLSPE